MKTFFSFLIPAFFFGLTQGQSCQTVGLCSGSTPTFEASAANYDVCQDNCFNRGQQCQNFTFDVAAFHCYEFDSCSSLDTTCQSCFSGERTCEGRVCGVQGYATGPIRSQMGTVDEQACLDACKADSGCTWYTWSSVGSFCTLLQEFDYIDTADIFSVSGESGCGDLPPGTFTKLMVVGGHVGVGITPHNHTDDVEVINLDPLNPGLTCEKPTNYPMIAYDTVSAFFEGHPLVCGGHKSPSYTDECYYWDNVNYFKHFLYFN